MLKFQKETTSCPEDEDASNCLEWPTKHKIRLNSNESTLWIRSYCPTLTPFTCVLIYDLARAPYCWSRWTTNIWRVKANLLTQNVLLAFFRCTHLEVRSVRWERPARAASDPQGYPLITHGVVDFWHIAKHSNVDAIVWRIVWHPQYFILQKLLVLQTQTCNCVPNVIWSCIHVRV